MITKKQFVELRAKCEGGVFPIEKIPELLDEIERLKTKFNKTVRCSFCGKSQKEVRKLVAGDARAHIQIYICDECLDLSAGLMATKEI